MRWLITSMAIVLYPWELIFDSVIQPLIRHPQFTAEHLSKGQIVAVISLGPVETVGHFPGPFVQTFRIEQFHPLGAESFEYSYYIQVRLLYQR